MDDKSIKYLQIAFSVQSEDFISYVKSTDYMTAPASTKYHNSRPEGLIDHSVNVTRNLLILTKQLGIKWERRESPFIIGMFHDLCKANVYAKKLAWRKDANNKWESYDSYDFSDQDPLGHGEKSVILMLQHGANLTEQEMYCIRYHMGSFGDRAYQSDFSNACRKVPEILYAFMADMMAGMNEEGHDNCVISMGEDKCQ